MRTFHALGFQEDDSGKQKAVSSFVLLGVSAFACGRLQLPWILCVAVVNLALFIVKIVNGDEHARCKHKWIVDMIVDCVCVCGWWELISWFLIKADCAARLAQIYSGWNNMMFLLAVLACGRPANWMVKKMLKGWTCRDEAGQTQEAERTQPLDESTWHAGALIGTFERVLFFILAAQGQYELMGYLLGAKSILRYPEVSKGSSKAEYVLGGTLISLTLAFAIYYLYKTLSC